MLPRARLCNSISIYDFFDGFVATGNEFTFIFTFQVPFVSFRFGEQYARMLLMLSMVVMYSISCPLITPFGRFFIVAGKNVLPKPRRPGLLCVQAPGGQAQPCLCLRQEQDQQGNPQVCSGLEVRSGKVCKFCLCRGVISMKDSINAPIGQRSTSSCSALVYYKSSCSVFHL